MIDYALWEVIENGATLPKTTIIDGVMTEMPITTVKEKAHKRLEVKARSTLMMGNPNEDQLMFNSIKDAKKLLEAVEKRFGFKSLNKAVLDTMSMDDLYKNLKMYEPEVKGMSNSSSSTKNMAFMDLRWQMAMLTMRARRFLKNIGRKLTINGNETIDFNKSKVECYNCHKRGHFARECGASRNQDNMIKESSRRSVSVEITTFTALVSCDGLGEYDWSD
ncbi:reverse transcriptase domain-containing protein [Tanacetum coccineum]